ncbi:hypothetical protein [Neisseria sicca]|uniref:hypothetical protein n=1 Tax=Neisseria sicca TaxID=490 RepID=UPI001649FE58|nr:hypothetical protein [Neisseria sicca]
MNKQGRLKTSMKEFISLKPESQSFQTTLFLLATRPLSRLAGEGWGEGGSTG